eukprot:jgi/Mesvir1/15858/Mv03404-RA.1
MKPIIAFVSTILLVTHNAFAALGGSASVPTVVACGKIIAASEAASQSEDSCYKTRLEVDREVWEHPSCLQFNEEFCFAIDRDTEDCGAWQCVGKLVVEDGTGHVLTQLQFSIDGRRFYDNLDMIIDVDKIPRLTSPASSATGAPCVIVDQTGRGGSAAAHTDTTTPDHKTTGADHTGSHRAAQSLQGVAEGARVGSFGLLLAAASALMACVAIVATRAAFWGAARAGQARRNASGTMGRSSGAEGGKDGEGSKDMFMVGAGVLNTGLVERAPPVDCKETQTELSRGARRKSEGGAAHGGGCGSGLLDKIAGAIISRRAEDSIRSSTLLPLSDSYNLHGLGMMGQSTPTDDNAAKDELAMYRDGHGDKEGGFAGGRLARADSAHLDAAWDEGSCVKVSSGGSDGEEGEAGCEEGQAAARGTQRGAVRILHLPRSFM